MVIKKKLTLGAIVSQNKATGNRKRNESFNSEDAAYLRTRPSIKLGKNLGTGLYGEFREIENSTTLGIKVPNCYHEDNRLARVDSCKTCYKKQNIINEFKSYTKNGYNNAPMMIPTKIVKVERNGNKCIGLVRPLVNEADGSTPLTDSQIRQVHDKVIELSKQGIVLLDGIQCGFTPSGRALQFDLGGVVKGRYKQPATFYINRNQWLDFLTVVKGLDYAAETLITSIDSVEYDEDPLEDAIRMAQITKDSTTLREFAELKKCLRKYGDIVR
jgi:hypothetical protein